MNKREISKIRKQFSIICATVDDITVAYVTEEKQIAFTRTERLCHMADKEIEKYLDLLKKGLSGKIGKNLYTMNYPTVDGGSKEENAMNEFRKKQYTLKEPELFNCIVEKYKTASRYVILAAHGVYDVPSEDGSVYEFIEIALCPVQPSDDQLVCDTSKQLICGKAKDMLLAAPTDAFLYPAFHDGGEDIHSILYYTKKPDKRQDELLNTLVGKVRPLSADEEMTVFLSSVKESGISSMEVASNLYDRIKMMQEEYTEDEEHRCSIKELEKLLKSCDISENSTEVFCQIMKNELGEKGSLRVNGLMDTKKYYVKNNYFELKTDSELAGEIFVRDIDGQKYLLCPIKDSEVEINGIIFHAK